MPRVSIRELQRIRVVGGCALALLIGLPAIAQAADSAPVLPLACFLSDGTLANATSGQLRLVDPITDSPRYAVPATAKVVGLVCNPKKLQVVLKYDGGYKEKTWAVVSVDSGKVTLTDLPFEVRGGNDYYYQNYNKTFFGVSGTTFGYAGRGISFSADGELLAAYKNFGWDNRTYLSVFSSADFSEIAVVNLENLLGDRASYQLLAINAVTQQYVDVFATTNGRADQFYDKESIRAVRWYFRDGRKYQKNVGSTVRGVDQGPTRGRSISDRGAFWDFNPLVGGFIGGKDGAISMFGSGDGDSASFERFASSSTHHFPITFGSWILGRNVGMTIGFRYAADGNTKIEGCASSNHWATRPYVFKVGQSDFIPMPCGSLDPWGQIAVDVERGYIFNTSKGKPDRLIKVEDFSDVRKAYFESLQAKYGITFRKAFVKAQQKERYVPSVSNTKTVSETLFYVGGEPVTRYNDYTTTREGYNETIDIYDLVYEVRNNADKPLAIRLRVEGLAKSTSWEVKTLSGGFWQALFGGRSSTENVREKENITLPMKIEKTLILKPGETFKSKDVWGEFPANQDEISIRAIDVQEVEQAWLDRLNDLLAGKALPTRERIDEFLTDPRSSWASEKLLELHNKFQAEQDRQRTRKLMQNLKIVSVSVPKDYDPDFENTVAIELQNGNAVEVDLTIQLGSMSLEATVPAKTRKTISATVSGVEKSKLTPVISAAR